ncbi:hypothetical protein PACILC2_03820 [Paenibacillus cisolokensis]|uniref:Uncharacterized protein n=1 Tax=Paenibacillus cisolokensis TaxID=1658519 RepID=A0ABQ4N0X8_9BACL|nr:hypothetical protein PACILC2_03820 [Paenibacillus cisolokensis]
MQLFDKGWDVLDDYAELDVFCANKLAAIGSSVGSSVERNTGLGTASRTGEA